jgi:hypothetical protein
MKKITIVIVGTVCHDLMRFSIEQTLAATPEVEEVIVFSDQPVYEHSKFIQIRSNFSREDYQDLVLKQLWPFLRTEFMLLIQYDGMAVNTKHWTDQYYNYDYIGSPWPERFNWIQPHERVGNGGFSWRSAKLLDALRDSNIQRGFESRDQNEDAIIAQAYRHKLVNKYSIKFAPIELANQFGHEWSNPSGNTFGFHGHFNTPLYFDDATTVKFVEQIPLPWYSDQLEFFIKVCHDKNYVHSLTALNSKLEAYLG